MKQPQQSKDLLLSELLMSLNGELHPQFQELFELVSDALADRDGTKKMIAFSTMMLIAEENEDLLETGTIQEGSWASSEAGWQLVHRNLDGYSVWYHPDADELLLQRNT